MKSGSFDILNKQCSYSITMKTPSPIRRGLVDIKYKTIDIVYDNKHVIESRSLWDIDMVDCTIPKIDLHSKSLLTALFDKGYNDYICCYKGHRLQVFYPDIEDECVILIWDVDLYEVVALTVSTTNGKPNVKISPNFYEVFDDEALQKAIIVYKEREAY